MRTLDRLRLAERLPDDEIAARGAAIFRLMEATRMVEVNRTVLERAAQPSPTSLGTLDAIHLATALLWRERSGAQLVMATHDQALGVAPKASGLRVVGA